MGIDKLIDVYNPLARPAAAPAAIEQQNAEPQRTDLVTWKDSVPILLLSEYLKMVREHGITLYWSLDKALTLHFEPGLRRDDIDGNTDRGKAAFNALGLLHDAADDLRYLLREGLLDLPRSPKGA